MMCESGSGGKGGKRRNYNEKGGGGALIGSETKYKKTKEEIEIMGGG